MCMLIYMLFTNQERGLNVPGELKIMPNKGCLKKTGHFSNLFLMGNPSLEKYAKFWLSKLYLMTRFTKSKFQKLLRNNISLKKLKLKNKSVRFFFETPIIADSFVPNLQNKRFNKMQYFWGSVKAQVVVFPKRVFTLSYITMVISS